MRRKKVALGEIVDVYGFRIVVEAVDTCTLGGVHSVYKPMPGRFKDYIAIPRANGYQSLHDAVRSEGRHDRGADPYRGHAQGCGVGHRGALAVQGGRRGRSPAQRSRASGCSSSSRSSRAVARRSFSRASRSTCSRTRSTCSRPRAKYAAARRDLRRLAYAVHTDVGNRCVAAKVDRRLVPLRTPLRNGQTVEVITAKGATPNPSWANFVVTAKARARFASTSRT